ncbi:hypothetical protein [Candidatus Nitrospira nitrosa]|uniref:hypothetical protein n=1 Tax=Candidatus Nitrospira nitrosa TaxID=1742972 RepID=UPI00316AC9DF
MKGVLAWRGLEISRTHDLEELQRLCTRLEPWAELASCELTDLTAYAVELRDDQNFGRRNRRPSRPSSWLSRCAPAYSLLCHRRLDRRTSLGTEDRSQLSPSEPKFRFHPERTQR